MTTNQPPDAVACAGGFIVQRTSHPFASSGRAGGGGFPRGCLSTPWVASRIYFPPKPSLLAAHQDVRQFSLDPGAKPLDEYRAHSSLRPNPPSFPATSASRSVSDSSG